jgi:hypothetical protein
MIEHWFAKRGQFDESPEDGEGYEKVLDMYCLHVLPRIEEWDYAREFLQYESELPQERRKVSDFIFKLQSQPDIVPAPYLVIGGPILGHDEGAPSASAITDTYTRQSYPLVTPLRLTSTLSIVLVIISIYCFYTHSRPTHTTPKRPHSIRNVRLQSIRILCFSSIRRNSY